MFRQILVVILFIVTVQSVKAQSANDTSRITFSIGFDAISNICSMNKDYDSAGAYTYQKEFEFGSIPGAGLSFYSTKNFRIDLLSSYAFFKKSAFDSVINNEYGKYVSRNRAIQFLISPTIPVASFGNGSVAHYFSLTGSAGLSLIHHRYFNNEGALFSNRNDSKFMYSVGFEYVNNNNFLYLNIEYLSVGKNKFIQFGGVIPIITLFKIAD